MIFLLAALIVSPISTEITLPAEPAPLVGTLVTPEGPTKAAVLFVPDPLDGTADGSADYGYIGSSKDSLASGFAEYGIASVRYTARELADQEVLFAAYGRDISPWAELLADRTGQPCVWLASYRGSTLISHAAAVQNSKICGLVAFSPDRSNPVDQLIAMSDYFAELTSTSNAEAAETFQGMIDILDRELQEPHDEKEREEIKKIQDELKSSLAALNSTEPSFASQSREIYAAIKRGEIMDVGVPDAQNPLPVAVQRYFVAIEAFDHADTFEQLSLPILAITEDVSSPPEIEALAAYKDHASAQIMVFERMARPSMGPSYPIDDYIPGLPRVPETGVVKAVADFILTPR